MRGKAVRGNSAHFLALRRRLDLMGYKDLPLGLDSAPLVAKMMEDLVVDTETLRENEEELAKLREKVTMLEEQLEPLQSENNALTRDLVQLRQEMIQVTEDSRKVENQSSATAFELQAENRRLKLLNQKASEHVKRLQKEIDALKKKLDESLAAPSMMKVPEVMECDPRKIRGTRTPSSSRATSVVSSVESSFSAPSVGFDPNLFNTELDNLRKERDQARKDAEEAIAVKSELENLIAIRDAEIQKLGTELQKETGRDGYMVTLRYRCDQQAEELDKLRAQMRVINPENRGVVNRRKRMVLTPARTTVSVHGSDSGAPSEFGDGRITYEAIGPMSTDSRMMTESSAMEASDIISEPEPNAAPKAEEPEPEVNVEPEIMAEQAPPKVEIKKHIEEKPRTKARKEAPRKEKSKIEKQRELREQKKQEALIASKDRTIASQAAEIQKLQETIVEKEKIISSMSVDFAFINDNLATVFNEKDSLIEMLRKQLAEPDEIIIDTGEIDKLQQRLRDIQAEHSVEIKEKDAVIEKLERKLAEMPETPVLVVSEPEPTAVPETTPQECQECAELRRKLDELLQKQQTSDISQETLAEIERLKSRNEQLETLIRTAETGRQDSSVFDAQLQQAKNELTERDAQIEKMRAASAEKQKELDDCKQKLEETERKMASQPNTERRWKEMIDQLQTKQIQMSGDIKAKTASIKSLSEKVVQGERVIRDLQLQLQKTKEEADGYKEDAAFHRTKGQEISQKSVERANNMIRETTHTVQTLQRQLQEKTRESEVFQKLLSEARRQLAPLSQTVIPQFKVQITQMQNEREALVRQVKKLAQFAVYVEQAVQASPDSPDAKAFCAALHQLQEELKVFE